MTEQSKEDESIPKNLDEWLKKKGFVENKNPKPRAWIVFPGSPLANQLRKLHESKDSESEDFDS